MTDSHIQVEDVRLREILAGCEGVTPGPWKVAPFPYVQIDFVIDDTSLKVVDIPWFDDAILAQQKARYFARLDPATVSSIVTELLALRAENERLRGETYFATAEVAEFHRDNAIDMWRAEKLRADALQDENAALREGIKPFAEWPGDSSYLSDTDKVWTVTFHSKEKGPLVVFDFRRARHLLNPKPEGNT